MNKLFDMNITTTKFPSPTGVLYLLIWNLEAKTLFGIKVSVPYWGSLSSNKELATKINDLDRFPSPTGVLYLLIF